MLGFVGILRDGTGLTELDLNRLAAECQHGADVDTTREVLHLANRGAMVCVYPKNRGRPIVTCPNTGVTLVGKGRVAPFRGSNGSSRWGIEGALSGILENFLQQGPSALLSVSGVYALAAWDPRSAELYLATDPLGLQKLCLAFSSGGAFFGTEYGLLARLGTLPQKLDSRAVSELITIGYPLEQRTLTQDVELAPPGLLLNLQSSGYSVMAVQPLSKERWFDASLEECGDRLGSVISEVLAQYASALDDDVYVAISGGLDSRTLLGFAAQHGTSRLFSGSYGHAHTLDVRIGHRVAKAAGIPHRSISLSGRYFSEGASRGVVQTEGEISAHSFHGLAFREMMPLGGHLWTGFLGDALSGGHLDDTRHMRSDAERRDAVVRNRYLNQVRTETLRDLVNPVWQPQFIDEPRETLCGLLAAPADTFEDSVILFDLLQRQRRWIGQYMTWLGEAYEVSTPFCDPRIVSAFRALPPKFLYGQVAYRHMIARFLPKLAAITHDKTGRPIRYASTWEERLWAARDGVAWFTGGVGNRLSRTRLGKPAVNMLRAWSRDIGRVASKLSGGWVGSHNRHAYVHYERLPRRFPDLFRTLFSQDELLEPYFLPDRVRTLLEEHIAGRRDETMALLNLWTLCSWRKHQMNPNADRRID